jgi:Ca2+-transporting ATPase
LTSRVRPARTPLERRLDQLGRRLVWISLGAAAVVAVLGALRGEPGQAVQVGLALAVAAVPEGLPVVATIALAVAVHRMARRRALVRRLPAVETLGSATLICTDKTGTLTAGEMTVTDLWVGGVSFEVTGSGYAPDGDFLHHGQLVASGQREALDLALRVGALANRAGVDRTDQGWTARGDPTEAALLVLARKAGLERDRLLQTWPEVAEVPFSSSRRWMATLHRGPDGDLQACVKGAPERVLEVSGRLLTPDGPVGLDEVRRREVLKHNQALASRGLRVLALAFGPVQRPAIESVKELTFIGLVGMIDPPAPGVADTIRRLREAGVRTIMLTGDQRPTAEAVGGTLGLLSGEDRTFDGAEVARLEGSALAQILERAGAFSRLGPEEKLKLVDAYQRRGEIVAMLGDGVNDAAALKKADIGVVMGARGSDVAREVATVVLQDDRFATVAAAVEEGRVAFDNIRKFIFYLFSCNLAEVMLVLGAGVMGLPLPVLPLQILWLNLITDTFPALALAVEPGDPEVMKQPPRDPRAAILSRRMLAVIASYAALITFSAMAAFVWMLRSPTGTAGRATSAAFATLGLAQSFHLGNARSAAPVTSRRLALRNRYALAAVGVAVAAQVAAVHVSPLARALHVSPLLPADWLVVFLLAALPALAGQVFKHVRQARLTPES